MDQKEIDRIFYRDGYRLADRHLGKEISTSNLKAGRMLNEGFVACLKQKALQVAELPIEQAYSSLVTLGQTMEDWVNSR